MADERGRAVTLVLAANAKIPSARAQAVQVVNAALGFQAAGAGVALVHAERSGTPEPPAREVFDRFLAGGAPPGGLPEIHRAKCVDWIDRVPTKLQFVPARTQEWSFGRSAARLVDRRFGSALVVARDVEVAHALRGRGPRVAWEVHRVPGARWRRRLARRALGEGVWPVAISSGVAADLAGAFELEQDAIPVLHDAVDPRLAAAMPSRVEARAALGLDPHEQVVLYAGGLLRWKGVETLVDAARGGGLGKARVVIAGGMPQDVARLRAYTDGEPAVRIEGFRPAREIPTYLAAADVGVVPNRSSPRISSHYTSPMKVFEALAAGLPLVVSDLPSLREVLDEETAVFFEPEEPAALARAINALLADPDRREIQARTGRERVASNTWRARAERFLSLFAERGAFPSDEGTR